MGRQPWGRRGADRAVWMALAGVVLSWAIGGCATTSKADRKQLSQAVELFQHDLRWKYFQTMAERVDPRYSGDLLDWLNKNKDVLNVVGWEVYRLEPLPGAEQRMQASVRVSYFLMPSTVVKEETLKQTWKDDGGRWILVSQKGGPFEIPLAPEPPEASALPEERHDP